jgi:hypothetical protein
MSDQQTKGAEKQAVAAAEKILSDEIGIIEGCRIMVSLLRSLDRANEGLFLPFIAVESETDHLPIGEARRLWEPKTLEGKEEKAKVYLEEVRRTIFAACWEVIALYGRPSGEAEER